MIRIPRLALIAYVLALTIIVCDQALKYWVLDVFGLDARLESFQAAHPGASDLSLPILGPFHLSHVYNSGVSFGFLNLENAEWMKWVLSVFSLVVAGALAVWAWKVDRPILALAVGLIIGGAVGNAIDRLRLGAVTDFLDFTRLMFPWVFNLADSAISVGSVLLIWDLFLAPRKKAPG